MEDLVSARSAARRRNLATGLASTVSWAKDSSRKARLRAKRSKAFSSEADVTDTHWRLGHYEILEEIGRGGMGVIYRARQQHSRRIVALKRILAYQANSNETLVRFRREAEAVAAWIIQTFFRFTRSAKARTDCRFSA